MKERPILFSAPMVRAIIDGRKTQTRRVVKPQPDEYAAMQGDQCMLVHDSSPDMHNSELIACPYGQPGDQLWVRETFCPIYPQDPNYNGGNPIEYDYAATYKHGDRLGDSIGIKKKWTPSIYMPRAASRIELEITGVRVERLQDISEEDAIAEGVFKKVKDGYGLGDIVETIDGGEAIYLSRGQARFEYRHLWESINGPGSWDANPWVWVIEFRRIKP
jgi:hypothetical protein